jgi:hypothetical protein
MNTPAIYRSKEYLQFRKEQDKKTGSADREA